MHDTRPAGARAPSLCSEQLEALAREHGTPLYVYDFDRVRRRIAELDAFDVVRYAMKANSNLTLLSRMRSTGVALDAVSAGEIARALAAGFSPQQVVYSADLFDRDALDLICQHGVRVNAGSMDMLPQLAAVRPDASLTLRLNPGFGSGFAPGVTTGGEASKHGIWHTELERALRLAHRHGLMVDGLHLHIGSGIELTSLEQSTRAMRDWVLRCGAGIRRISAGGGLPVPYRPDDPRPDLSTYVDAWRTLGHELGAKLGHSIELETEPGRFLVAEAGVLLTEIRAQKRIGEREFWIVDAGFQTLARPMLYDAWHHIEVLGAGERSSHAARAERVVAGPLCEASDLLTTQKRRPQGRLLPEAKVGDLLCIFDVGAYGASMASNYNSRPLPAEVLVEAGSATLVRRRQSLNELFAWEAGFGIPASPA